MTPLSELIADPARGLVYGNRGCLHDATGRSAGTTRRAAGSPAGSRSAGWQRGPLLRPGRFTELFFLDEATAFAAGHRPCALCRRADYDRLSRSGASCIPPSVAPTRSTRRCTPSGSTRDPRPAAARRTARRPAGRRFVLRDGAPWLVLGDELLAGRRPATASAWRGHGASARLLTPPSLVELLRAGGAPLVPRLHPSAAAQPRSRR